MRLIDADVLKQHIDKLPALPDGNFAGSHSALKALINMQPTVQPYYVTGSWLIRKWGDDAKCSNCGKTFKDVYDIESYDGFCRHCGAKMGGIKVTK